jgi:hypothetical protein
MAYFHDDIENSPVSLYRFYNKLDAKLRPKCENRIWRSEFSEVGDPNFQNPVIKHLAQKYKFQLILLSEDDWDFTFLHCIELIEGLYIACMTTNNFFEMRPDNNSKLLCISLVWTDRGILRNRIINALQNFLNYLSEMDGAPECIFFYPNAVSTDPKLKYMDVLGYKKSRITTEQLTQLYVDYFDAKPMNRIHSGVQLWRVGRNAYLPKTKNKRVSED